ncbi:MAG TPA: hypothetical protein VGP82_25550 [Ktedonobacterales bacterium]|jgi:hypothetical protein|nr:hypothetical protein [Ktedonobacterales bacterium]
MKESASSSTAAMRASERRTRRAIRSIDVASAGSYGAILCGAIYLAGCLTVLAILGITSNADVLRDGFVLNLPFVGLGLVPLLLPVAFALFGGVLGITTAILYNILARHTGGIVVEFEDADA